MTDGRTKYNASIILKSVLELKWLHLLTDSRSPVCSSSNRRNSTDVNLFLVHQPFGWDLMSSFYDYWTPERLHEDRPETWRRVNAWTHGEVRGKMRAVLPLKSLLHGLNWTLKLEADLHDRLQHWKQKLRSILLLLDRIMLLTSTQLGELRCTLRLVVINTVMLLTGVQTGKKNCALKLKEFCSKRNGLSFKSALLFQPLEVFSFRATPKFHPWTLN